MTDGGLEPRYSACRRSYGGAANGAQESGLQLSFLIHPKKEEAQ